MKEMAWIENNLGVTDPQALQDENVDVFFPPNVASDRKVVDLSDGRVKLFPNGEGRPPDVLYADFETLEDYCRDKGCPLIETEGYVQVQPVGKGSAGDPLRRWGH